jgi:ubiquinone/menaquinone biosynthesis C-methylase UbiE
MMTDTELFKKNDGMVLDDVKKEIRHNWDVNGKYYDRYGGKDPEDVFRATEDERCYMEEFASVLGKGRKKVLDVGSGTGFLSVLLARMGHDVTGVDFSREMLARSSAKTKKIGLEIQFLEGDAEAVPLPGQSFDAVVNRWVLWTQPHPEKAVSEWARLCKRGGTLVIIDSKQGKKSRIKRIISYPFLVMILLKEGRTAEEILTYGKHSPGYAENLPHANGVSHREIAAYMEKCGLKDIKVRDLGYIADINLKGKPWPYRVIHKAFFATHLYLVAGTVPE